jgi:hypothetical protein
MKVSELVRTKELFEQWIQEYQKAVKIAKVEYIRKKCMHSGLCFFLTFRKPDDLEEFIDDLIWEVLTTINAKHGNSGAYWGPTPVNFFKHIRQRRGKLPQKSIEALKLRITYMKAIVEALNSLV